MRPAVLSRARRNAPRTQGYNEADGRERPCGATRDQPPTPAVPPPPGDPFRVVHGVSSHAHGRLPGARGKVRGQHDVGRRHTRVVRRDRRRLHDIQARREDLAGLQGVDQRRFVNHRSSTGVDGHGGGFHRTETRPWTRWPASKHRAADAARRCRPSQRVRPGIDRSKTTSRANAFFSSMRASAASGRSTTALVGFAAYPAAACNSPGRSSL